MRKIGESATVVWDGRWVGQHGIARHANEIQQRLHTSHRILKLGRVVPASPLDALYLRGSLKLGRGDIFVTPGFNASLRGPFRQLLTVHDLIHLKIDDESSRAKRLYYTRLVRPAIQSAQRVLTVSQFSRTELINWTGLPPEDVVVVGNGCSFAPATRDELHRASSLDRRTILFVGNAKPHKNFSLLVASLRHLANDIRVSTVGVKPAFVAKMCEGAGVAFSRFEVLPRIPDNMLRELYATAGCVALPSTYEGFGLAALEGMAMGTPSAYLCDAVAEVVGDLGHRADGPGDAEAFADAMTRAIEMKESFQAELIARAMTFSWDDAAKRVEQQIIALRS